MNKSQINPPLKVTVVGDGTVGKTCLLIAYTTNQFPVEYVPTVFDNYSGEHSVEGSTYAISLWDTAGQEEYSRLRSLSYPQTIVFIVCFSLENRTSFDNVASKWLPELRKHSPSTPIVLVGTKKDIRNIEAVSLKAGKKLCKKEKLHAYIECSSKNREGINEVITSAIIAAVGLQKKRNQCCIVS